MYVKYNVIPYLLDFQTANATKNALKMLYETKNTNRVLFIKCKLMYVKMEENYFFSDFISRIKDLKDKLEI